MEQNGKILSELRTPAKFTILVEYFRSVATNLNKKSCGYWILLSTSQIKE